jgi:hypothetical protein
MITHPGRQEPGGGGQVLDHGRIELEPTRW